MISALLTQARALAARQAWGEVCALLSGHRQTVRDDLDLLCLLVEGLLRTGAPREARALCADTLPHVRSFGANPTMRRAVNLCGAAHFELGELDEAQEAFERAADLARQDGDDLLAAQASNNLALIANIRGHHEEALALYRVALPAYQRLGNGIGLAQSLHNMAITYRDLAALDEADEHERRAADYARQDGDDRLVAIAMVGRAEVQLQRADASLAEATALFAAERFAQVPDPARRADALRLAGVARARRERVAPTDSNGTLSVTGALTLLDEAVSLAQTCGAALIEGECLRARAELRLSLGDIHAARRDGESALAVFVRLKAAREHAATQAWLDSL